MSDAEDQALPKDPPYPPGWEAWWSTQQQAAAEAIRLARLEAIQTAEFVALKRLEAAGLLGTPVAALVRGSMQKAAELAARGKVVRERGDLHPG